MAICGISRSCSVIPRIRTSFPNGLRFLFEGAVSAEEGEILGIYTPVTKRLWIERQQRAKLNRTGDQPHDPVPVPPRPITITYPFSTSYSLKEQVRNLNFV
jgi:hypothetical protein